MFKSLPLWPINISTTTSAATAAAATSIQNSECLNQTRQNLEHLEVNLSNNSYLLLALITTVGLIVSLVSNMIIIYIFTSTSSLRRNPSNIIAVNLSLSDLLYCTQWPSVIYCSLTRSTWILENEFVCQAFGFISVSTALASILTVLAMSIERAIVISYSIYAKRRFSIRGAWLIIVIIWLIALASSFPPLFGKFNRYTLDPSETSCTRKYALQSRSMSSFVPEESQTNTNLRSHAKVDYLSSKENHKIYILALYIFYWIVPTVIISISYTLIIVTFKRSSLSLKQVEGSGNSPNRQTTNDSIVRPNPLGRARRKLQDSIRLRSITVSSIRDNLNEAIARGQMRATSQSSARLIGAQKTISGDTKEHSIKLMERDKFLQRAASSLVLLSNTSNQSKAAMAMAKIASTSPIRFATSCESSAATYVTDLDNDQSNTPISGSSAQEYLNARRHTAEMISLPAADVDRLHAELNTVIGKGGSGVRCRAEQSANNYGACTSGSRDSIGKTVLGSLATNQSANSQLARTVIQFRLAKTALYLILLWLVSWTPIASVAMINSVQKCHKFSATAIFLANTMTKLGPALDVLIYGVSHPKIKSKFRQIFKRLFMLSHTSTISKRINSSQSSKQTLNRNSIQEQTLATNNS